MYIIDQCYGTHSFHATSNNTIYWSYIAANSMNIDSIQHKSNRWFRNHISTIVCALEPINVFGLLIGFKNSYDRPELNQYN